jgi:hypothetical protein
MDTIEQPRMLRIAARAKANSCDSRVRYRSAPMPSMPQGLTYQSGKEQRRHGRHDLGDASVSVRRIGGFNFSVRLRDVSAGGCGIELIEPYDVSDQVIARFKRLDPLGASVCWTSRTVAGIEFHRAIHPAVFENLLGRLIAA